MKKISKELRAYLSEIGRLGGKKKSKKKTEAAAKNWKKAVKAIKSD